MSYFVTLSDAITGEVRKISIPGKWNEFEWNDGNCACDCVRFEHFYPEQGVTIDCAMSRFRVIRVDLEDGTDAGYSEDER